MQERPLYMTTKVASCLLRSRQRGAPWLSGRSVPHGSQAATLQATSRASCQATSDLVRSFSGLTRTCKHPVGEFRAEGCCVPACRPAEAGRRPRSPQVVPTGRAAERPVCTHASLHSLQGSFRNACSNTARSAHACPMPGMTAASDTHAPRPQTQCTCMLCARHDDTTSIKQIIAA